MACGSDGTIESRSAIHRFRGTYEWLDAGNEGVKVRNRYGVLGEFRLILVSWRPSAKPEMRILDCKRKASRVLVVDEGAAGQGGKPVNDIWRFEVLQNGNYGPVFGAYC